MPQAPWLKYQQAEPSGPWTKYGGQAAPADTTLAPSLLQSRRQASQAEFEQNRPESTLLSRTREAATGLLEPFDLHHVPSLAKELGGGFLDALTNKGTGRLQDMVKGAVTAPAAPIVEGVDALRQGDYDRLAHAAGGFASTTVPAIEGAAGMAKAGARAVLPEAGSLQRMANANKARALGPTTLQGRADAGMIAEELSKTGKAKGLRGSTIDRNVLGEHEANGQRVAQVEDRLRQDPRPEMQTGKQALLAEIDAAKAKLNIPRTGVTARPEAVTQFDQIRGMIDQLPDFIDFDQLIEFRRQLDARAAEAGAFGVNADNLKADISRGAADMVRGKLNALDPELKTANHDYSVSRKAADLVERRHLGETGKMASGLPGRGQLLDDILATWAGHALGGPVGGAVMEGVNLARQSRGFANLKGSLQQDLANFMAKPQPAPLGLLGTGDIRLPAPETSGPQPFTQPHATPRPRLQLPAPPDNILDVDYTIQPSSGEVFGMPPAPPKLLTPGQKLLPEQAGSPFVTPLRESLREQLRRFGRGR